MISGPLNLSPLVTLILATGFGSSALAEDGDSVDATRRLSNVALAHKSGAIQRDRERTMLQKPLGQLPQGGIAGGNPACGAAANHDCFTTGGPGCTDEVCCNAVCALDSFCCTDAWDGICVSEALNTCPAPPPRANDNCADAIQIGLGDAAFSTIGATTDGPPTSCIDIAGDPQVNQDIWFNFFAPNTYTYFASTCGSGYDTKIAVYEGCLCPPDPATEVACNDDFCLLQSEVTWSAIANNCYTIRVGGFLTTIGSGTLHVSRILGEPCDDPNNHACDETGPPGCNGHDCCTEV